MAFDVAYPARQSRGLLFVRLLLAIPHFIILYLLFVPVWLLTLLAWFGILFTGRYPDGMFQFNAGVLRWQANVFAYVMLLRDEYPPFSFEPGEYLVRLDIARAERQSRFRLFIRAAAVIPNYIVLMFVMYAWYFVSFVAWCAILITGRYPRGLFKFSVGVLRWQMRLMAYLLLLRDEYPPYSINADARPGNEVISAIVGVPLLALYVAFLFMPLVGSFGGGTKVYASADGAAIRHDHPTGTTGSLRITLLDFQDPATPAGARPAAGYRFVSFRVRGEKDGTLPTFYSPVFLFLSTCEGRARATGLTRSTTPFRMFWRGGSAETMAYFEVAQSASLCELSYLGRVRFVFR